MASAYEAIIKIGVQGQQELDRALNKVEQLNKAIAGASAGDRTVQSLQAYNVVLKETARNLHFVELGTKAETIAIRQYVDALGQANTARARQSKLIEDQIRAQRLAASGIRETPNQYTRPAGPAGNAADLAAGTFRAGENKLRAATGAMQEILEQNAIKGLKQVEEAAIAGIAADNKVFAARKAQEDKYWKARMAQADAASKREQAQAAATAKARTDRTKAIRGALGSGLIGGGFPLLFGQGAGASVGGLAGGLVGPALLGNAGGFAGGIVGSLLGTQFDKLKANALGLADALKAPSEALAAMEASGIKVGGALKNTVDALESTGRAAEAQALVFAELERLGGSGYVQNLLELEEANKELQASWSKMSVVIMDEMLPAVILLTRAAKGFADFIANSDIITRWAGLVQASPGGAGVGLIGRLLQGQGLGEAAANTGAQVQGGVNQLLTGQGPPETRNRQPQPVDDTRQRKALDEAVARQKEIVDLQRRGEDLVRAGIDFRRDQEEQIYQLRKKAADYDREVAKFRKDLEDKIADKQADNARTLAELTRRRRQNTIERLDQALEPAGQISALQGGGRSQAVDLAREYIRTIVEGQADLQQKETESKLNIAKVQREADKFSLDVADKVKDFSDKAADYAREVEKFKYETAKKVVDLQRQAADYTYAQWERVYKLAATVAEKNALAAQSPLGDVSVGRVGASGASIAKTLADALKLTPAQAAGIVGNLQRESGLNPRINEGGAVGMPRGVGGYGLAQWTGSRQDDLIRFAGGPSQAGDLRTQVRFIISELLGPEANALRQLRRTATPEEAAVNFDRFYERSGIKALGERQANARAVYNQIARGGATPIPATGTLGAAQPVSFPSAAAVAGAAPKAPSALPLTGVPSALRPPDASKLLDQYKGLNAESVRYLEDLQATAREAAKLSEIAAKTKLDRANAALGQQFLQPLLDANQALQDRAAYEREYGDLLKNGALPALAEQLATADQLERTQLRLLEREQAATQEAIKQTKAQLARNDLTDQQRKDQERILEIFKGQSAVLDRTRGAVIQQSDQQRNQIQAAESPEARRQRTLNTYNERINTLNDPNRKFDAYMKAKGDLAELVDPVNQLVNTANVLGSAFGDAFQEIISGSSSAEEALGKMFQSIGAKFLDMAAQILAQQALFSIMGLLGFGKVPGGGGGGGFLTGGLFNSGIGAGFGGARAEGGPVGPSSTYLVGENGPELFIPGLPGQVLNFDDTRNALQTAEEIVAAADEAGIGPDGKPYAAPAAAGATTSRSTAFSANSQALSTATANYNTNQAGDTSNESSMFSSTREAIANSYYNSNNPFATNAEALKQVNSVMARREVDRMMAESIGGGFEPIEVRVDAFDPAGAGLVTIEQLVESNRRAVAEAQAKIQGKMRNSPQFRRGAGLK